MDLSRTVFLLFGLTLTACSAGLRLSPYRIDVRQGNYVSQEMVSQLKPGMTKDQVRFVLGTPLLSDVFHVDRWDYVYRFQPGIGELQQRRLTVFFEGNKLARIAGDVVAAGAGEPAEAAGPAAGTRRLIEIPGDDRPAGAALPADTSPIRPETSN